MGRPETAAVLLCVSPILSSCRGLDFFFFPFLNGCHEETLTFMDATSGLTFSPSLSTALHSALFLFQRTELCLPQSTTEEHLSLIDVHPRTWEGGNMT